jgi:hypothetical protein
LVKYFSPDWFNNKLIQTLQNKLIAQKENIDVELVLKIYQDLKSYSIIDTDESLLKYLSGLKLNKADLKTLIGVLNPNFKGDSLREIVRKNYTNRLSHHEKLDVLNDTRKHINHYEILIDEFISEDVEGVR